MGFTLELGQFRFYLYRSISPLQVDIERLGFSYLYFIAILELWERAPYYNYVERLARFSVTTVT